MVVERYEVLGGLPREGGGHAGPVPGTSGAVRTTVTKRRRTGVRYLGRAPSTNGGKRASVTQGWPPSGNGGYRWSRRGLSSGGTVWHPPSAARSVVACPGT